MEGIGIWLSPLLLMPGAGLLIMSTSARYAQVHGEMHHLLEHAELYRDHLRMTADELLDRCILFRNALISLYIAVALFATGGLLGAIAEAFFMEASTYVVIVLTGVGILSLVIASYFLVRESTHSMDIIKEHYDEICIRADEMDESH